jgi:hypothetical protein
MSRIRQIKPEYFADPDVAELPIRARLTYVGLWTIADDAGWLPRLDAAEIGHALYGYESGKVRAKWIIEDLEALQASGHVEVLVCGHGHIPTLPKHQRVSKDRTVFMHRKSHENECLSPVIRGAPRNSSEIPTGKELVGNGTVRNGNSRERDDGEPRLPSFEEIMSGKLSRTTAESLDDEVAELARQGGLH